MFTEPSLIIVMTTINIGNNNMGRTQANVDHVAGDHIKQRIVCNNCQAHSRNNTS